MKERLLLGMLGMLLFIPFLSGCEEEETDFSTEQTATSTIVEGKAVDAEGNPIAGVPITLDYHETPYYFTLPSLTRHKAEGITGDNGTYRLVFQVRDDELQEKEDYSQYYQVEFYLNRYPDYILPTDFRMTSSQENTSKSVYRTFYDIPERGKTYEASICIPKKRMLRVDIEGGLMVNSVDEYAVCNTIRYDDGRLKDLLVPVQLTEGQVTSVEIPCALNDSNRISLQCMEGGYGSFEPVSDTSYVVVGEDTPESVWLSNGYFPDESRFRLEALPESEPPFVFEKVMFRMTDGEGHWDLLEEAPFLAYYDSIVWSADGFPQSYLVYSKEELSGQLPYMRYSQWPGYFFDKGIVQMYLKGYRGGRVVYADSLRMQFSERDFLCFDWENPETNPTQRYVAYCPLDKSAEYVVFAPIEKDGYVYTEIHLLHASGVSDEDYLERSKEVLSGLMNRHSGSPLVSEAESLLAEFHCLPEDVTPIACWQSESTRVVLVFTKADERGNPAYYLHIEPRRP